MSSTPRVLLVDDHLGDIRPVIHHLEWLGYAIEHVANKEAAQRVLESVAEGKAEFALAIIDIMVSTRDISDLADIDASFLADSQNTGLRLCEYAREELSIPEEQLRIVCLSARSDDDAKDTLHGLGISLYGRVPKPDWSILDYIDAHLSKIEQDESEAEGHAPDR